MRRVRVVVEKVLQYNWMKKLASLITILVCFSAFAQKTIIEKDLMVFKPTESSKKLNKAYSDNMFFGLFGIKPFINALDLNEKSIKTVTITNASTKKVAYKANYDAANNLLDFELTEEVAKPLKVKYTYQDGLIATETIDRKGSEVKVNQFYYDLDKMYIKNSNSLFDVTWLEGDVMLKKTYLDQKLGFEDRLMHDCRITKSLGQDINKICFSSSTFSVPFKIKEYTPDVEPRTEKINLVEGQWSDIKLIAQNKYVITMKNQPQFEVVLDQNQRIKEFKFLGNKVDKQQPLTYNFTYTFYK
ncbi:MULTISPECIES: hypothetical protein [Empedobacter]|uniref:DUF4595 domain-containing protein n=1 Tax=Empedobacter falsenii TaxID=343874 RepID=A0A7H9DR79_9FLAO|nr:MULTISPECIES: hypothetical protein [Empedobacter]MDH2206777.1 hypothetical protein [Empedobacter sp. GD03644]QLL57456.1 hypothetical protein FH779_04885 [Empedobacter falsenii]